MNEMNEIGPRLRELREASDYTVERLAAELKVDPDVYRGYEQDGKDIPISLIYEVANKFGVDFAEILTGTDDRAAAAKMLYDWGAREVLITHNTEVLVYDGREIYTCPIRSRNLSGRTGRGDTTFAGYINERLTADIPTALRTATALVSLKMETPGPFRGSRADVEQYQKAFYE